MFSTMYENLTYTFWDITHLSSRVFKSEDFNYLQTTNKSAVDNLEKMWQTSLKICMKKSEQIKQNIWKHCGKLKNGTYCAISLFLQCFQISSAVHASKCVHIWEIVKDIIWWWCKRFGCEVFPSTIQVDKSRVTFEKEKVVISLFRVWSLTLSLV